MADDLVYRLRERARIRRSIASRKSVQEGKPDRISDLLEEAADEIEASRSEDDLGSLEYCPYCHRTDAQYKRDGVSCASPWHADDHLRARRPSTLWSVEKLQSIHRAVEERLANLGYLPDPDLG